MPPENAEFKAIESYVQNTNQGSINFATHKLKVFKIEREGEEDAIQDFKEFGNKKLLFHGSSLFNFVGILS